MIAVFAGTSDGKTVINQLLNQGYSVACFNATIYGGSQYEAHKNLRVFDRKLDKDEILMMLKELNVSLIVDCTHPYAVNITKNLIQVGEALDMSYIRYERPNHEFDGYDDYQSIMDTLEKTSGNILLTIGSHALDVFAETNLKERIFCRVLPTVSVIQKCHDLGFSPKQIIGMQGPFSEDANRVLMKDLTIQHMVTKASGSVGGFMEKINAAKKEDVNIYVLNRPKTAYELAFDDINSLIKYIENNGA